ncbi:CHAD domain-containing protein [Kamptonema sp. UHCC 0994]|uniref:CHAD domain-containing protein n=1 Tax=Kamptonema sp. UHCC 0994 TaxID=3031329 RepID=UPI0023BA777E|nr:CHAD domain-containing protein [Kamptonema sp. UHCC 0994]MDF0556956.1 CHAD domain-containing protein [Kamptonema sp. UHCC 0994]
MKAEASPKLKTLGAAASQAIEKYFEKIIGHEAEVLKDRDPEELHQMRVGMRRLRSAVTGFAPVVDLPKETNEKKIGKISRVLGELRDLDVMLDSLQNRYYPTLPSKEQEILDKSLLHLLKQRHRALKKVRAILEHKHYQMFKQSLRDWLEKPCYHAIAQLPVAEVLPDLLLPQVSEMFLHPGWLIGVTEQEGKIIIHEEMTSETVEQELTERGEIVHDLRKQAKRVRYLMSLFTEFYGETYEAYLGDVKAIQEYLGDIQDSAVLAEFITDIFDFDIKKQLPTLAEIMAQSRFESWQKWQLLQQRYLTPEVRQNFRSELIRPKVEA